ncbi:Glycosyltransferase BC10 [Linum grandiflorum]
MRRLMVLVLAKHLSKIGGSLRLAITTLFLFCFTASIILFLGTYLHTNLTKFFSNDSSSPIVPSRLQVWHSMSDVELFQRASMEPQISNDYPVIPTPKLAFMFLIKDGSSPYLAPLWELFFKGHNQSLYSIYLHVSSLHDTKSSSSQPPTSSIFYNRIIPSKPVRWGTSTMVDAERRLLANALLDFSNQRFILLSESCIPLFNFTTIYNYLVFSFSNTSFLGSIDDPRSMGRGRYNKRMQPDITLSDWRKGSQWFEVHRKVAIPMVSDVKYYHIFRQHCKPPCYMDEHYFPTLVTKFLPEMNSNHSITWVDWSKGGSHPTIFLRKDVCQGFLIRIRNMSDCDYSVDQNHEKICFLFARKFHPSSLEPLLRIAPSLFGFNT